MYDEEDDFDNSPHIDLDLNQPHTELLTTPGVVIACILAVLFSFALYLYVLL
jgi:hypothetical protein